VNSGSVILHRSKDIWDDRSEISESTSSVTRFFTSTFGGASFGSVPPQAEFVPTYMSGWRRRVWIQSRDKFL